MPYISDVQTQDDPENDRSRCDIGHGRRVVFICCSQLVQDLLIAKRDLVMSKLLKKLSRYDAIIVDDIGYVQQSRQEMEVLFTFLADRYERGTA
jgi:DNA replication protein DnaC